MSPQEILVGSIIAKEEFNLRLLIVPEIASQAQQKKTSLSFLCLIIELCCVKFLFNKKKHFEYTLFSIVDITLIELVGVVIKKKAQEKGTSVIDYIFGNSDTN